MERILHTYILTRSSIELPTMSLTEGPDDTDPSQSEFVADSEDLIGLLKETLAKGNTFRFDATGRSMEPFIRSGDTVSIAPLLPSEPRLGDVLAFNHPLGGRLLVHRVVQKRRNEYLMKGDSASDHADGWVKASLLLGKVNRVSRGKRKIFFGLGVEKYLIALLSRQNWLVPILNHLRRLKQFLKL